MEYLIILSADLGYLPTTIKDKLTGEAQEIARMIHALRQKVEGAK